MMHHGQPFIFPFLRQTDKGERKEIRNGRTNLIKQYIRKDKKKKRIMNETKKDKTTALN